MRTCVTMLIGLTIAAAVPSAGAAASPDSDQLGVYFDQFATVGETIVPPFLPFAAYFIITNPTSATFVQIAFSYQVDLSASGAGQYVRLSQTFPPGAIMITDDTADPLHGEVIYQWPAGLTVMATNVVLTWQLMLFADMPAEISIAGVSTPMVPPIDQAYYWDGSEVHALQMPWCTGYINTFCPLDAESRSFGTVKALYR